MPDYDDCVRLRELFKLFTETTTAKNKATELWMIADKELCLAIAIYAISDKLSWKKQCISLISKHKQYAEVWEQYCDNKVFEKVYSNSLKAIENETNVLKKIYEHTPN